MNFKPRLMALLLSFDSATSFAQYDYNDDVTRAATPSWIGHFNTPFQMVRLRLPSCHQKKNPKFVANLTPRYRCREISARSMANKFLLNGNSCLTLVMRICGYPEQRHFRVERRPDSAWNAGYPAHVNCHPLISRTSRRPSTTANSSFQT